MKIHGLLIGAAAEVADVRVLHYDYDLIVSITGQDVAWMVAQGSVS